MRVTSADVARESGVSRTTVSYVLNDKSDISIPESTRQRVRDAAERLGYTPSAAARALRRGRTDIVLCVVPDWPAGPVIDALLDALTAELEQRGLALLVHHQRGDKPLAQLWRAVTPRAVLGLAPFAPEDERAMRRVGIEVFNSTLDEDSAAGRFSVPQTMVGELQVEHLVERGHRVIAYASTDDPRLADFAERRASGVMDSCLHRGLPVPELVPVALDIDAAVSAIRTWRQSPEIPTAVATYNDEVALAIIAGLHHEGLRIPEDMAVIGVDDIPMGRLSTPPLTTVWQAAEAQAHYLAAAVVAALDGAPAPHRPENVLRVISRGST